jgi:hypothetical protein
MSVGGGVVSAPRSETYATQRDAEARLAEKGARFLGVDRVDGTYWYHTSDGWYAQLGQARRGFRIRFTASCSCTLG